ncbi:MAG: hypothetical protein U5J98_05245 [Halobacteriales archaeon]|nr:hypothetical protein [Halobacteriales archaeon]
MDVPDFTSFLPQEGFVIDAREVEGVDLYEDMDADDEFGESDERPRTSPPTSSGRTISTSRTWNPSPAA